MTESYSDRLPYALLTLLLDDEVSPDLEAICSVHADYFVRVLQSNVILVRVFDRFAQKGIKFPECIDPSVIQREKDRVYMTLQLIAEIGSLCNQYEIDHIFTKAFQHYPDMGHDIDLFVRDRSPEIDRLIKSNFGVLPEHDSILNLVSGKRGYRIEGYSSPVEVHHGRLGHLGEHNVYPGILLKNKQTITIGPVTAYVPCPEDQIIIQGLQRICGHFNIRLSDAIHTINLVKSNSLDWNYMADTAKQIGAFDGVCSYLTLVDKIFGSIHDVSCFPSESRKVFPLKRCNNFRFNGEVYVFSRPFVAGRAYIDKYITDLRLKNWESLGKLSLLPFLALFVCIRNGVNRLRRRFR